MATPAANPTSELLQDMLREKKAQSQRVKKTYDLNGQMSGQDNRGIQSSPIASMNLRDRSDGQPRRSSVRNATVPKEMGIREMEEYISKISKQNFDLKLEVFHRRQRNEVLKTRLEKLQELESNNEELQSINEELLLELEKRDVAIQEAVGLICDLEEKNNELQMAVVGMDFTQSSGTLGAGPVNETNGIMASPLSTISGTSGNAEAPTSDTSPHTDLQAPPEHSLSAPDTLSPPKARPARRIPNFTRDTKKSTQVLRSMYSTASFASLARPASIFSGDEDDDYVDRDINNSPRLSLLSESGFSSIYGGRKDHIFGERDGVEPPVPELPDINLQLDSQRETRLHKWLDERNLPRTPSQKATAYDKSSSIDKVISEEPPFSRVRSSTEKTSADQEPRQQRTPEKQRTKQARSPEKRVPAPSFGGPLFGSAVLPPTPDTMSTATLDADSFTPSIITEKSLLDGTSYSAKGYSGVTSGTRVQTTSSTNGSASPRSLKDSRPETGTRIDAPTRPLLTAHRTGTSNEEPLASTQASRTLSYPSPTSRARRLSDQRSLASYKGSDSNSEKTVNQSPQERLSSGSAATITPTRRTAKDDHYSPLLSQDGPAPSPLTALPHLAASPQPQRSSSLRSKIANKFTRHIGNASRIPNPSPAPQPNIPSRPPMTRAPATTQPPRRPRPSSLYGQHPVPTPSTSPTYDLSPILPNDMLTDLQRYSDDAEARHLERRRDRR
ncbi:hypothetical protein BDR22DRAFT_883910 [Usnea florida]